MGGVRSRLLPLRALTLASLADSLAFFELKNTETVDSLHTLPFSRTLRRLPVFASGFDWFAGLQKSFVSGESDYLGFGFTTLK